MRKYFVLGLLGVTAIFLAACGGSDENGGDNEGGSDGGSGGEVTMTVASSPIGDVAPLFLGAEEGIFAEQGINVEEQFVESGAVVVPAVVRGSVQAGFANTITVLSAEEQGLPLRILAIASSGGETTEQGYEPMLVAEDSDIQTAADLAGRTVAVSSLDSIDQISTIKALENEGVDPNEVEFIEVPRSDMLAALEAGRIDAATVVEPFAVEAANAGGFRVLFDVFADAAENVPVAVYFTTAEYADANPDEVERFSTALQESLEFATENPDLVREIIPTYTEISPELITDMTIPQWVPPSTGEWDPQTARDQVTMLAEWAVENGVLASVPDMDQLFSSYPGQ